MKSLKKLTTKPIIGPIAKKAMDYMINRQVTNITKHFSQFLAPKLAINDTLRDSAFNIRHQVYCEELEFEEKNELELEKDEVDEFSIHCLIQQISTKDFAGTVRIVRPTEPDQMLPIEKYCLHSITNEKLRPDQFERHEICEISRLAVPPQYRRRKDDKFKGAATGVINEVAYSEKELRCFPFIAIGLYFSAASIVIMEDIKHTYVMMEPRLARSMSFVGIKFEQLGPVVDYHGKRAPYYINPKLLIQNLSPGFKNMLDKIESSIQQDYNLKK